MEFEDPDDSLGPGGASCRSFGLWGLTNERAHTGFVISMCLMKMIEHTQQRIQEVQGFVLEKLGRPGKNSVATQVFLYNVGVEDSRTGPLLLSVGSSPPRSIWLVSAPATTLIWIY